MHQISSKVDKPTRRTPKIDRLEAEYQKNQERIRQLHRRNNDLAAQIRSFSGAVATKSPVVSSILSSTAKKTTRRSSVRGRRSKSLVNSIMDSLQRLNRARLGKYSLSFWLKATGMMVVVAMVCGSLGFLFTRLIGLLIGS